MSVCMYVCLLKLGVIIDMAHGQLSQDVQWFACGGLCHGVLFIYFSALSWDSMMDWEL